MVLSWLLIVLIAYFLSFYKVVLLDNMLLYHEMTKLGLYYLLKEILEISALI